MKFPTKPVTEPKQPAAPMPDVRRGDHVYFHVDGEPHHGEVKAAGKHGVTVLHGGRPRPIRWENLLGHKERATHKMRVVARGGDGAIVEDEGGRRQYLAGYEPRETGVPGNTNAEPEPYNEPERPVMAKSLPLVLFLGDAVMFKALANKPGLSLQAVTDKAGKETKRWKKSNRDEPFGPHNVAAGDHLKAKMGTARVTGQAAGVGKDGATIKDETGRHHEAHWHEVTHHAPAEKAEPEAVGDGHGLVHPDHFHAASFAAAHDKPGITPEDIIKGLPPEAREKVEKAEADLARAEDTSDLFRSGGKWTAERAELHKKIVAKILSPEKISAAMPADGERPTFTILGGRGGSGKSKLHGVVFDPKKAIVLDNDEIKKMLPEYQGWNAGKLHIEAADIFKEITEIVRDAGLNIVHDSTMVNQDATLGVVDAFEKAGYNIEPHYMHVPRHVAAERSVGRFLDPKDGRYVPPSVVLGNIGNEATFDAVKAKSDKWSFRDNTGPKGSEPRLISQKPPEKSSEDTEKGE